MSNQIWDNVLTTFKSELNDQSFTSWFLGTEVISEDGNEITVKVADDTACHMLKNQYSYKIESITEQLTGKKYKFNYIANIDDTELQQKKETPFKSDVILNPDYTFENFITGSNNQLAQAAAEAVSKNPGGSNTYNPLLIYGESGLGKTHLLQAIGHYILKERAYKKVCFISTETFISEFINGTKTGTMESFKKKYRSVDVLLIDDIQFLSGKESTQDEFFNTFNSLHEHKKQIVISSDRHPKEIATLTDRLLTRFTWGMIADIKAPELETREAILLNKAEKIDLKIDQDACNYIAKRIKTNIRSLEGAVSRLKLLSSIHKLDIIRTEHVKLYLKDFFDVDADKKISIEDIVQKVSIRYDVTSEELKSGSRHGKLIEPRHISMYLARRLTDKTTTEIGNWFGKRDHSTVINAQKQIEKQMQNQEFKSEIDDIIMEIKS